MRIAQIAPLSESVPPRLYGGTERIVHYLTEELVRLGHDVTLFASGDSTTSANLVECAPRALRLDGNRNPLMPNMIMLDRLRQSKNEFDVLHFHIDLLHYPLVRSLNVPFVTTLHGRLDLPGIADFYSHFPELPLVSISLDQRKPMPPVNWAGNVYHGLPSKMLSFSPVATPGYLAFLGRISPEKRPDLAIEIAVRSGRQLKIAAKIDPVDQHYWTTEIEPLVTQYPNVEYVGEIGEDQKADFLGGASALIFPIDWPEPFGLVMIESMACGTPVIAFNRGSVSEVIEHNLSGLIVENVTEAVVAVEIAEKMSRSEVRATFDRRFSATRMANEYLAIFHQLCAHSRGPKTTLSKPLNVLEAAA
jgi:glycosyltransferase involved in cell wall biosynthesis